MTDTTKTRDELIDMALDELGAIASGQSAEAEDQEKIDSRFDGLVAELASRGVCYVSDDSQIPIEWSGPLAELLANECAPSFGKQKMALQDREMTEDRLRIMVNRIPAPAKTLESDPMLRGTGFYTYSRWLNGT